MIEPITALVLVGVLNVTQAAAVEPLDEGKQMYEAMGCISCHGPNGNSPNELHAPSLAGMDKEYILKQITDFLSGERKNPIMEAMAPMIEGYEEEVADYLSKQVPH